MIEFRKRFHENYNAFELSSQAFIEIKGLRSAFHKVQAWKFVW